MKCALAFLVAGWAMLFAQQEPGSQTAAQPKATEAASESGVPDGVRFWVRMKSDATSSKAKAGDAVKLELIQDVKDSTDRLLLPKKATLSAHILRARAHAKELDARLSILVDKAEWEGHSVQLNALISAIPLRPLAPTPWKGPGGPVGGLRGDPVCRGCGPSNASAPENKPEFNQSVPGEMEDIKIGYFVGSEITVLYSKTGNIRLDKGTAVQFRQLGPH